MDQQLARLAESAEQAAILLKAMANKNRLMVLCALIDNELSVSELNQCVPLSQSALSQHLSALRQAELVSTRRKAQIIYYQLKGNEAHKIITVLKSIYCPESS